MSAVASPTAASPASGCPIDHSKLSKEQWEQWSNQHTAHLARQSQPTSATTITATTITTPQHPPTATTQTSASLACDSSTIDSSTPYPTSTAFQSVGDVFPDSKPSPNQRLALSTLPIASSIPRSGTDPATAAAHTVWTFPSPQRFYNAMLKKGWSPNEHDMPAVVSIHNTVNEHTWARVSAMERSLHPNCRDVRLARFRGRPNDLSVKARVAGVVMGAERPFDRHDWVVDRCGKEVRYVIDFYGGRESELSGGQAAAVHIDARPAIDDVGGLYDRLRLAAREWL